MLTDIPSPSLQPFVYAGGLYEYLINLGPYAVALAGGLWPKSLAPATGGRRALL